MGAANPQQAILEELVGPPVSGSPAAPAPAQSSPRSSTAPTPFQADPSTIRFVKHRESERRHLYFVTFDGTIPQIGPDSHPFSYIYPVERDLHGDWRVRGGAGGAGDQPRRATPWVNLAGGGWPDQFYAGGRIHNAGIDIARVELRFANGITLEDDTEAGVALFITDQPVEIPATLALLDRDGNDVSTRRPFPGL